MVNDLEKRKRIDEIIKTQDSEGDIKRKLWDLGIKYQKDLKSYQLGYTIIYNCFAYALNFHLSKVYLKKLGELGDEASLKSNFIEFLLGQSALTDISHPASGDLIFYFKEGKPKHAGKIINIDSDTIEIESQWGGLYVFRHSLWDVSEDHGNEIKFFNPPDLHVIENHYVNFIEMEIKNSK